jgi:4,5-DOPA dioxygenase extradiol
MSESMPVLFIGHGSPENAIEDNEYGRNWSKVGSVIPTPKAILCISAHWLTEGTGVTAMSAPKTIHDFYGFPEELYKVRYKAKGSPILAKKVKELVKTTPVELDKEWGLDHGAWSFLVKMYPEADIPVIQLSIDMSLSYEKHYKIGKELAKLRNEGVLIIGSGNIVHNLMMIRMDADPYDWAVDFDRFVKLSLDKNDHDALINFSSVSSSAMAHPTTDHYIPLLYAAGAAGKDMPQYFNDSFFAGSLSMRSVYFGKEKVDL